MGTEAVIAAQAKGLFGVHEIGQGEEYFIGNMNQVQTLVGNHEELGESINGIVRSKKENLNDGTVAHGVTLQMAVEGQWQMISLEYQGGQWPTDDVFNGESWQLVNQQ